MKRLLDAAFRRGSQATEKRIAEHDQKLAEHDQLIGELKNKVDDIESRSEAEVIARGWMTDEEAARERGMGMGGDGTDRDAGNAGTAGLDAQRSEAGERPAEGPPHPEAG